MNRKDAQKRKQLVVAVVAAVALLSALYFLLIHSLQSHVHDLNQRISGVEIDINQAQLTCKRAPEMQAAMLTASNNLHEAEASMANGDVYFWMVKTLEDFQRSVDVEFNAIDPPKIEASTALPKVSYPSARFNVTGKATYHDFGQFLARFENAFPYMHLSGLELDSSALNFTGTTNSEELRFKMEVNILAVSNNSTR